MAFQGGQHAAPHAGASDIQEGQHGQGSQQCDAALTDGGARRVQLPQPGGQPLSCARGQDLACPDNTSVSEQQRF